MTEEGRCAWPRLDQRLEMMSRLRDGRRLEKARNLDLELHDVVDIGDKLRDKQRVSAQGEEVIVDPDPFDLEDLCPAFGQYLLKRCPRRDEVLRHGDAARQAQLCRQADTLHFARRASRELP